MDQGSNSASGNRAGSRRVLWMLVYVAVVAGGVLAALQARRFWLCRQEPAATAPNHARTGASQTQAAWAATSPAEMIADPLAGTGLRQLQGHPGQIGPPEGARLASAFQRRALGRLEQQGRYELDGSPDAAAEHYVRALTQQGFKLGRDSSDASGRRELLFVKGRTTANLILRKRKRQEKIVVELTVIVSHPEP